MASKADVGITPQQEEEVEASQGLIPREHQEVFALLFSCEEPVTEDAIAH